MKFGAWLALGFAVTIVTAQGCNSSSAGSPGSSDSGESSSDAGETSPDAGTSMACDGSLPTEGAGGGAACTACRVKNCVAESATCAGNCACGPIEDCLETSPLHSFTECPNAIAAVMGGNPPLTMLTDCLDLHCLAPCFMGGGSEAGGGDQ
jgi:hypothetical protein